MGDEADDSEVDSPDSDFDSHQSPRRECFGASTTGKRKPNAGTPLRKKRVRGELSREEKKQPSTKLFQNSWLEEEEFRAWVKPVAGDSTKARCVPCNATFNAGKSELQKHAAGKKHTKFIKGIQSISKALFGSPETSKAKKLAIDVKKAEISLAAFFTEHNVTIMTADHLVQLLKKIFPDSDVAQKLTLDRKKCAAIMKNVLSKTEKEEIISDLQQTPFSVLIDESTDRSEDKNMCLLVKFVSPTTGRVRTPLLEMIKLDSTDCSAEALYHSFKSTLTDHNIPMANIIGLACDHAPVMVGVNNSFATRLKAECPWLVLMDCICHSSHIAASKASEQLPSFVLGTIRRLISYTSGSPKSSAVLREFQEFYSQEHQKLMKISLTRWLIMHPCVVRILANLVALEHYFMWVIQEDKRDKEAAALLEDLRNLFFKAYLLFLKYSLEYFNEMNALFQHEKVLVHKLQSASKRLLTQVYQNYMRDTVLESIVNIDVTHPHFQLPLHKVYFGPGVEEVLTTIPIPVDPSGMMTEAQRTLRRENDVHAFKLKCLDFYLKAAQMLKLYLPLKSSILKEAAFIEPVKALSSKVRQTELPDLRSLCLNFKDILQIDEHAVSRECRNMPFDIPAEKVEDMSEMEPEMFWLEVGKMKDFTEIPKFPNLAKLARVTSSF